MGLVSRSAAAKGPGRAVTKTERVVVRRRRNANGELY